MNPVYIASVGLLAPGLDGWAGARATLRGTHRYRPQGISASAPEMLPANERRRATALTRIALMAAQDALANCSTEMRTPIASDLRTVFASSHGDAAITDRICRTLSTSERAVSPTDFHNSVHNAPAGYWSIGTRSQTASTSVSLLDGTFSAGLLEAITIAGVESAPVLLVAYDIPLPFPLCEVEKVGAPFAVALILTPEKMGQDHVAAHATLRADVEEAQLEDPDLESLRLGNPAARSLTLLKSLADTNGAAEQRTVLPYLDDCRVEIATTR